MLNAHAVAWRFQPSVSALSPICFLVPATTPDNLPVLETAYAEGCGLPEVGTLVDWLDAGLAPELDCC